MWAGGCSGSALADRLTTFQTLFYLLLLCCHSRSQFIHPRVLSPFSRVRHCGTPWTVACQAPLFMGFSRQEYWSGLPFPSPRYCTDCNCLFTCLSSPNTSITNTINPIKADMVVISGQCLVRSCFWFTESYIFPSFLHGRSG